MSSDIRVVDWIDEDDVADEKDDSFGWMGGWFNAKGHENHRWNDYLKHFLETTHPYLEAVRREVLEKNLHTTGEEHQNSSGVPVFSDGKQMILSYRAWGDLMAAIWSEKEDKNYSYMDFYM